MSSIKKVIVLGASGSTGAPAVAALLKAGFEVTVLTRKSSKATFPSSVRVVSVADDYPTAEVAKAFEGQDAVVDTSSMMPEQAARNLFDAAEQAGVKRFIPSEFGGNTQNSEIASVMEFPFGQKHKLLKYLKTKESSGLSWTAIGNGVFFDWSFQKTQGHFLLLDLQKRSAVIQDEGNDRFSCTNLNTVALAIVRVLQKPEETKNKFLFIQSFSMSQNELLAALEKEIGGPKFEVTHVKNEEFMAENLPKAQAGDFGGIMGVIIGTVVKHGNNELEDGFANELLELPKEDLETSLKAALKGVKY